jgi:hypothetical protein
MNTDVLKKNQLYFNDFEHLFQSLSNEVKKYSNGFWGTTILVDPTPFHFERDQLKRGKKLSRIPKNKEDKTFHLQNEKGEVIAMFGYTGGWNEPCCYDFIKKDNSTVEIFNFDIEKKLVSVQQNFLTNNLITESVFMLKNEDYVIEIYHYDDFDRIVAIERQHKDKQEFWNTSFFPDNVYKSEFVLEYNNDETQPLKILWDANPQKILKPVWVKE